MMMKRIGFRNISSPFSVAGSDTDLQWELSPIAWHMVVTFLYIFGIGQYRRYMTYRIEFGPLVELFLVMGKLKDVVTAALDKNLLIMLSWGSAEKEAYLDAKNTISVLSGKARKHAKADLARQFGLNPIVYGC